MVSTRHHPRNYPPPDTPSKTSDDAGSVRSVRSTRGKSRTRLETSATSTPDVESPSNAVAKSTRARGRPSTSRAVKSTGSWTHTPSHITIIWLLASLPLVTWDTLYIFGRPHTFPGGWLHAPIWSPYKLYFVTDLIYGQLAWDEHLGFTAAQGFMNIIETALYVAYLWIVYKHGEEQEDRMVTRSGASRKKIEGRGAPSRTIPGFGWLGEARVVNGAQGGLASMIGFSAAVMTLAKTILYALNEHFSGYRYVGHNEIVNLVLLYILPNGLWLIFPTYMTYAFGADILEGLAIAAGAPVPDLLATKEE